MLASLLSSLPSEFLSTARVWGVLQGRTWGYFLPSQEASFQAAVGMLWWLLLPTALQLTAKKDVESEAT